MKKNRRVGNQTGSNFYITDFKLRSEELKKDSSKKLSQTGSNFHRCRIFDDKSDHYRRGSREKMPVIEQLTFLNSSRKEDFRLPKSLTKRSQSKNAAENEKSRLQRINNRMYQNLVTGNDTSEAILERVGYMDSKDNMKKIKSSSITQITKQKLQRNALERFQQMSLKQNEGNVKGNSEKKAEALFRYLRESRMKQQGRGQAHPKNISQVLGQQSHDTYKQLVSEPSRSSKQVDLSEQESKVSKQIIDAGPGGIPRSRKNIQFQDKYQQKKMTVENSVSQGVKETDKNTEHLRSSYEQSYKESKEGSRESVKESFNHEFTQQSPLDDPFDKLPEAIPVYSERSHQKGPVTRSGSEKNQRKDVNMPHGMEKILTLQHFKQSESQNKPPQSLAPPPKLLGSPARNVTPRSKKTLLAAPQVDEDELEELDWDGKKINPPKQAVQAKPKSKDQITPAKPAESQDIPEEPSPAKHQAFPGDSEEEETALDKLFDHIETIEDIGQYRLNSKDIYSDKSIGKQLLEIYSISSYYMAHQFYYLTRALCEVLEKDNGRGYLDIESREMDMMRREGELEEPLGILKGNLQQGKNLLQKCYKDAKDLLKDEKEGILLLDGKINYAIKCSRMLIKQFKIIYSFYQKSPKSVTIKKRCCYLIEVYCRLKTTNGDNFKEAEDVDDIEDFDSYIEENKHFILGQ